MGFRENATELLKNAKLKQTLQKATSHSLQKREKLVTENKHWEELRTIASEIRTVTIDHLAYFLRQFIENAQNNGIKVHQAVTSFEANSKVLEILSEHDARLVVKAKSMLSEELELNKFLRKHGINSVETDLGEYIIQQAGEPPSHITAPAIHKSREEIGKLFQQLFGGDYTDNPEELTKIARKVLREKFLTADAGISGANFLVADRGMVAILENEGNIRLSTSTPPLHIIIAGIEKLIPRIKDLAIFLRMLPVSATGQRITSYLNLISGPREDGGPREIHLILVDNGRTNFLMDTKLKTALHCIKCGACMNTCPIFQLTGGHAYSSPYPGPIGSVLTPVMRGVEKASDLPFASTLCGACSAICPVKIPIPTLLLELRQRIVAKGLTPLRERLLFKNWKFWMSTPGRFRIAAAGLKSASTLLNPGKKFMTIPEWSKSRNFPKPASSSFRHLWKRESLQENKEK